MTCLSYADHLADSREESVELGRSAAREFVREMIGSSGESNLLTALKTDLENIRVAANTADQRTQETLESVHGMLARVVDRLTRLEADGLADAVELQEQVRATGTYGGASPAPPVERRPPEPGMNKPDIAALRELARSAAHGQREPAGDRRADFIAAARRAARTAAPEATDVEVREGERRPGAFARIGHAIRNRRRPLLLAAPALILTVLAIQAFTDWGDTNDLARPDATSATGADAQPVVVGDDIAAESPAVSTVGKTASPAPVDLAPTAVAFALPESRRSRFGPTPDAPPATEFVRTAAFEMPLDREVDTPTLRAAAAAGNAEAAATLAARYAEGKLVRRDLSKAAYWYERAAERGNAIAQYRLASLYQNGEGVEVDRAAAAAWYKRAADLGNVGAMHNLAVMMSDGVEGTPNYLKAVEYYRAAAEYGVADSQYNLGVIYARGLGLERDLGKAYKWFALAAAAGDVEAGGHRDEISRHLPSKDLAEAHRVVAAWRPKPSIAEANAPTTMPDRIGLAETSISEADRRSLVMKIQTLLADQGYDPGPADGFDGPKTQEAVRAYQRNIGLAETGKISSDLMAALVDLPR